jgi:hypothetical protein
MFLGMYRFVGNPDTLLSAYEHMSGFMIASCCLDEDYEVIN